MGKSIQSYCKPCFKKQNRLDFNRSVDVIGCPKGTAKCLLFVHGGGGCRAMFKRHAESLKDKYTSVLMDLPGHGALMDTELTRKSAFDEILRVANEYCVTFHNVKPIYIGGSLGAYLGMELLGTYPDIFSSAVLTMAGQNVGVGRGWAAWIGICGMKIVIPLLSSAQLLSGMVSQAKANGNIPNDLLEEMVLDTGMFFNQSRNKVEILGKSNPLATLGNFAGRILFINGSKDYRDSEQIWLQASQKGELKVYEGGDHFFSHDVRFMDRFLTDISDFVS